MEYQRAVPRHMLQPESPLCGWTGEEGCKDERLLNPPRVATIRKGGFHDYLPWADPSAGDV
jgi:hypothetical protein